MKKGYFGRCESLGKIIAVASGKGGTGKTTTVAAVSSCLAALGYKTLAIDYDAGMNNLDFALCMADFAVADYLDVFNKRLSLMEACHEHPRIQNLFFLAAPALYRPEENYVGVDRQILDEIRGTFDYCLIDTPSGIGEGFRLAHKDADMSVIVTNGELPAIRDAQRAAETAREMGLGEVYLLVNRVKPGNYKRLHTTIDDVIDIVGTRLLGAVREDDSIMLSLHENTPLILYRKRRAAFDFLDIARRIRGENIPLRRRYR